MTGEPRKEEDRFPKEGTQPSIGTGRTPMPVVEWLGQGPSEQNRETKCLRGMARIAKPVSCQTNWRIMREIWGFSGAL